MVHPLVGKQLVDKNPTRGQVTRTRVVETLGNTLFQSDDIWAAVTQPARNSWVIHHGSDGVITKVEKHF